MKRVAALVAISIVIYPPLSHGINVDGWIDGADRVRFLDRYPRDMLEFELEKLNIAPTSPRIVRSAKGAGAFVGTTAKSEASRTSAAPLPGNTITFKTVGAPGDVSSQSRPPRTAPELLVLAEKDFGGVPDAPSDTLAHDGDSFVVTPNLPLMAFPSAQGFGADTPGGRKGRVIEVTNLDDSGPGSLRKAIQSSGPRIVVFRVGGTIELNSRIKIRSDNSFLTVAGQTAPGGGVQLKNYGLQFREGIHDVVIRHLRIRPGISSGDGQLDAVTMYDIKGTHIHHIILDHVTMAWGIDENVGHGGWVTDVTYQWCIFAEGTTKAESGHASKGLLIVGDDTYPSSVSVHHSLFAHNKIRNPMVKGALVDFRNNIVYNWGPWDGSATRVDKKARMNIVNNRYIRGVDTVKDIVIRARDSAKIHVKGNFSPRCPTGCVDPWAVGIKDETAAGDSKRDLAFIVPVVTTDPTAEVTRLVLARAGATLPERDSVDRRIVQDVMDGTGSVGIGSGYPDLRSGTPLTDSDHDGMPDEWELRFGLDPHNPSDGNGDLDGDGYTNVEEYLNELAFRANL